MFIFPAIKHFKELWRVEGRVRSECLRSMRPEATINKVWERIQGNPLWKQKIMSQKRTFKPNQIMRHHGRSTHESAPPLKRTPPYCCFEGNPTDKSKTSSPVARRERAWKLPLHGWQTFHHPGAVQQPLQQDLCSKFPWGAGWGGRSSSPFLRHGLVGCPITGWHLFIYARNV